LFKKLSISYLRPVLVFTTHHHDSPEERAALTDITALFEAPKAFPMLTGPFLRLSLSDA
jgi:hypothetical protein